MARRGAELVSMLVRVTTLDQWSSEREGREGGVLAPVDLIKVLM